MSTVEAPSSRRVDLRAHRPAADALPPSAAAPSVSHHRARPWALWVGLLLLGALFLRLWGVEHGLPYAYNADENAHFVPNAIGIFGHQWNPDYFVNPPAYTYVLHLVFAVVFGGGEGVSSTFAADPTQVWIVARVVAAVLSTLAVWVLYLAGSRLFDDRRVGLLAAGLLAVAFLPVFYSHLALNDAVTLLPVCAALWGAAGILRYGRTRDYVIAGLGLGLACATKYTGGIVLLAIVGAGAMQLTAPAGRAALVRLLPTARVTAVRGVALTGLVALVAFVVANPYAILDFNAFWDDIVHQTEASSEGAGKLGATQDNGWLYYLWSLSWGLGWIPLAAAAAGAGALWFHDRRLAWVVVPVPLLYLAFMGFQDRFFGRWLLPIFPFVCLLAAWAVLHAADRLGARRPALRPTLLALAVIALCGQGLVYSLHSGLVLSREDTRNLARDWMVANVPVGEKIAVEPVVPDAWATDLGDPSPLTGTGRRWVKYPVTRSYIDPQTGRELDRSGTGVVVNIEDYQRIVRPELVDEWEDQGVCYVVSGSTQRGRGEVEPQKVPNAAAFYAALENQGEIVYQASPYVEGRGPVEFNFDFAFNFYPLAYYRPGPEMTIYRLPEGC